MERAIANQNERACLSTNQERTWLARGGFPALFVLIGLLFVIGQM